MLNIPVILGTARKERNSENVARFVHKQAEEHSFNSEWVDVGEHLKHPFTIPPWQKIEEREQFEEWEKIATKADGYIIVSPEYNHGYPGELKILLDSLYKHYFNKPVGIVGVSAGHLGGARMVEHLKQILPEYHMVPTRNAAYFGNAGDLFDENGNITDEKMREIQTDTLSKLFQEIEWYADPLREQRESKDKT